MAKGPSKYLLCNVLGPPLQVVISSMEERFFLCGLDAGVAIPRNGAGAINVTHDNGLDPQKVSLF